MNAITLRVAIALGSNMHDRDELLRSAVAAIAATDGVALVTSSRVEETEPFGPPQPAYLNQMVLVETVLTLPALLSTLHEIERRHGRARVILKGPRTLDLDIVWAGAVTITSPDLLIPHPGLTDRDFWQRELAELLGVDDAAQAIAAAQVHAGMDTVRGMTTHRHERWSGNWEPVA
jgi:2-amino-4-hydroxy-6-hydroxymethyldihydropteridine diphosphokinase